MKLTLGFSPCPNDTFIFDALVNNKIDCKGLTFEVLLEDVETLNQWALAGKLDITKLSYAVLPLVLHEYILLNSGSALGKGVGPLLVSNSEIQKNLVEENTIAIPGEQTTAHLLFSLAYPNAKNKVFMRYDEVEDFVSAGKGLGVIIHENRFTYADKGLHKITDLGDFWENKTGKPIPLGGIVIKRAIDLTTAMQVNLLIKESIAYAYEHHYKELSDYVNKYAQEMSEEVMRKHIDLYVNKFSTDLGDSGKKAVINLIEIYKSISKGINFSDNEIFIN